MNSFLKTVLNFFRTFFSESNVREKRSLFLKWIKNHKFLVRIGLIVIVFLVVFYNIFLSPPKNFPQQLVATIETGDTLSKVTDSFKEQNLIRSPFWFKVSVTLLGGDKNIYAGDYFFAYPTSVISVAYRVTRDDHGLVPIRITVFEGLNVFEMADLFSEKFSKFDKKEFIKIAPEGYLFPDTYFFLPNVKAKEVVAVMQSNFEEKIKTLIPDIEKFGKPLFDVVIMASILETEARKMDTRRRIADILWRRLAIGMPLQVDVSFKYVNGKTTPNLTLEDLEIDSPYNTYKYKGLPPTPIANPGLDAIRAAITPIPNNYFYFLTDNNGIMRYATTFETHKENRRLYLDR
ncbi:MAG: endolytic transglycosylase MltG [Patescibacteria group bacterium]